MIITSSDIIAGKRVVKTLGLVKGNTVRARHIGKDILATLKNMTGGEIEEYTKLLAQSRDQGKDRMISQAEQLGANAVINVRFTTSAVTGGAAELYAYGTAVILELEGEA